jgi:hypothetical protein
MADELLVPPNVALVNASEVPRLLAQIRPQWQAKDLINRVRRLLTTDPSSACQRLFNASVHDLREKVIIAGLDIAREAAKQHKLPPIEKAEDVENYSTSKLIDLVYRIGLISRAEWRRLSRCYEIRRDLEHEDDEYEAGVEDCVYIFNTCIEVVLSKDPVHLLKVTDVKELVEQPVAAAAAPSLLEDFKHAPQPRQEEILKFLISIALDQTKPDLVRQNAFTILSSFQPLTLNPVKLTIAAHLQERIGRSPPSNLLMRVAQGAGVLPYIKQAAVRDFFESLHRTMLQTGTSWRAHASHGELLRSFRDVGGLLACPPEIRKQIVKWLALTYVGTPGGPTQYGHVRNVFYSDTAAPIIEEMITEAGSLIDDDLRQIASDKDVRALLTNSHIARRFESLLDLLPSKA